MFSPSYVVCIRSKQPTWDWSAIGAKQILMQIWNSCQQWCLCHVISGFVSCGRIKRKHRTVSCAPFHAADFWWNKTFFLSLVAMDWTSGIVVIPTFFHLLSVRFERWHCSVLKHWGRAKMAVIFPDGILKWFSLMKIYEFRLRFYWSLFPMVQSTIFSIGSVNGLVPAMRQAIIWSNYD